MLTAERLVRFTIPKKEIQQFIKDQINIIEGQLRVFKAQWGKNTLVYDLPTVYMFRNLDDDEARKLVSSELVNSFRVRGFETQLGVKDINGHEIYCLILSWVIDLNNMKPK